MLFKQTVGDVLRKHILITKLLLFSGDFSPFPFPFSGYDALVNPKDDDLRRKNFSYIILMLFNSY